MERAQLEGHPCQSCGMPMKKDGDFGTEADGRKSEEYCVYCYQSGKFTQSDITLEGMQKRVYDMMVSQLGMPEEKAKELIDYLPMLKRWRG